MSDELLSLRGVHTHIGAYHILHGVDLEVPEGQVTMLLGRNGAGKTTTLRTIMGLWPASQGEVSFRGESIKGQPVPEVAQRGIAYVPENMGIFTDLTVQENMLLAARSARHAAQLDTARLDWIFGLFPALQKFWLYPAGKLSGGQKQMLAVALVEQNFLMARALGDRVAVMDNGRVVHAGAMAELAADEAMQQRLLGLSLGAHQ
jgi:branched-chain amino acid transport system ATP-binding protein